MRHKQEFNWNEPETCDACDLAVGDYAVIWDPGGIMGPHTEKVVTRTYGNELVAIADPSATWKLSGYNANGPRVRRLQPGTVVKITVDPDA